jgi:hypothetical protein
MSKTTTGSTRLAQDAGPLAGHLPRVAPGFHLFASRRVELTRDVVHVPDRVTYLVQNPLGLEARKPARPSHVILEPIELGDAPALLLVSPRGQRVRINGLAAPPVAVLGVRDELQVDDGPVIHVTEYRRPRIETPTGRLLAAKCGLCRVALTKTTTVLIHKCGVALHLETASIESTTEPEGERLTCATEAGDCPSCAKPVDLEEGYTWLPE